MAVVSIFIPPECGSFLATNVPQMTQINGTNLTQIGLRYTAVNQAAFYRFVAHNYGASNPNVTVLLDWASFFGSTTSGSVTWGAALSVLTPGDAQAVGPDSFATEATTNTTTNSTGNGLNRTSITITSLDSLTAADFVCLRIRMTVLTSFSDTALLLGISVQYPDV